jgi:16S rRNA (cytosine967-C5)-methyltransferase
MKASPARTAAFDVLLKIENEHAFSAALLPAYEERLSPVDRALCHQLVLGTLRRQLLLDRYIELLTNKKTLDIEVRIALRLGLFQLYYLERVPNHAIVNESVELTQRAKKSSARGLVNAVLRKASKDKPETRFDDAVEEISVRNSHPRWLVEKWIDEFGFEETEKLLKANNETPLIAFRRTLKGAGLNLDHRRSAVVDSCFFADEFTAVIDELANNGEIYLQDEASQMVASLIEVPDGARFLDVCASPGGKTTAVITNTMSHGIKTDIPDFFAGDITSRRVELLRETCSKQGAGFVNIVRYDATVELPFADASFDRVLVDAPCTGTGTIRHNPEIRYVISPDDFTRMKGIQIAVLSNAAKVVKPGGILVYSTCSLELEENEHVCKSFLENNPSFKQTTISISDRFLTDKKFARTFPQRDNMDGFFVAAFKRI